MNYLMTADILPISQFISEKCYCPLKHNSDWSASAKVGEKTRVIFKLGEEDRVELEVHGKMYRIDEPANETMSRGTKGHVTKRRADVSLVEKLPKDKVEAYAVMSNFIQNKYKPKLCMIQAYNQHVMKVEYIVRIGSKVFAKLSPNGGCNPLKQYFGPK